MLHFLKQTITKIRTLCSQNTNFFFHNGLSGGHLQSPMQVGDMMMLSSNSVKDSQKKIDPALQYTLSQCIPNGQSKHIGP